jgi:hypothetical protein
VVKNDEDGHSVTEIEARQQNGEWMPIKEYLENMIDEPNYKLIAGNVVMAARYFQQRVKHFINKIVMGKRNPMKVKHWMYRVEFQERGAGHIHGSLWLSLEKLKKLIQLNGELCDAKNGEEEKIKDEIKILNQRVKVAKEDIAKEEKDMSELEKEKTRIFSRPSTKAAKERIRKKILTVTKRLKEYEEVVEKSTSDMKKNESKIPFYDIVDAFRQLKNNLGLNNCQLRSIQNFVDEFTTVCLSPGRVGKDVAKIAGEVQRHFHTATCRKYGDECRFSYPRLPSPKTIITKPLSSKKDAEKKKILSDSKETLNKVKAVLNVSLESERIFFFSASFLLLNGFVMIVFGLGNLGYENLHSSPYFLHVAV